MNPSDSGSDPEDTVTVEMLPVILRADSPQTFSLELEGLWDGPVYQEPVRSHIASELADLESMGLDLRRVIELCGRLDNEDLDDLLRSAVWEAAVMAYGRCFNSGGRAWPRFSAGSSPHT